MFNTFLGAGSYLTNSAADGASNFGSARRDLLSGKQRAPSGRSELLSGKRPSKSELISHDDWLRSQLSAAAVERSLAQAEAEAKERGDLLPEIVLPRPTPAAPPALGIALAPDPWAAAASGPQTVIAAPSASRAPLMAAVGSHDESAAAFGDYQVRLGGSRSAAAVAAANGDAARAPSSSHLAGEVRGELGGSEPAEESLDVWLDDLDPDVEELSNQVCERGRGGKPASPSSSPSPLPSPAWSRSAARAPARQVHDETKPALTTFAMDSAARLASTPETPAEAVVAPSAAAAAMLRGVDAAPRPSAVAAWAAPSLHAPLPGAALSHPSHPSLLLRPQTVVPASSSSASSAACSAACPATSSATSSAATLSLRSQAEAAVVRAQADANARHALRARSDLVLVNTRRAAADLAPLQQGTSERPPQRLSPGPSAELSLRVRLESGIKLNAVDEALAIRTASAVDASAHLGGADTGGSANTLGLTDSAGALAAVGCLDVARPAPSADFGDDLESWRIHRRTELDDDSISVRSDRSLDLAASLASNRLLGLSGGSKSLGGSLGGGLGGFLGGGLGVSGSLGSSASSRGPAAIGSSGVGSVFGGATISGPMRFVGGSELTGGSEFQFCDARSNQGSELASECTRSARSERSDATSVRTDMLEAAMRLLEDR